MARITSRCARRWCRCCGMRASAGATRLPMRWPKNPIAAQPAIRAMSWQTDCVILAVLDIATRILHPLPNPTEGQRIAILAVGGYGRGEMAPESDVDLLFLTPYKITAWAESVIESMLYILWDMRLKVGHASRTIDDCLRLGREDFTIRTALLENRFLAGDRALSDKLNKSLWDELFKGTEREFIEAKLNEREERHIKQGNQRYSGGAQRQGRQRRASRSAIAVLDRQVSLPGRRCGRIGEDGPVYRRGI